MVKKFSRRDFSINGLLGLGTAAVAGGTAVALQPEAKASPATMEVVKEVEVTKIIRGYPRGVKMDWWTNKEPVDLKYEDGELIPRSKLMIVPCFGGWTIELSN